MPISNNPVLKLASNTNGHDYVIGDIHGCYYLLEKLLERVNFDTRYDRLFSVGDIVDPTFRTPIIENLNISKHTFRQAT